MPSRVVATFFVILVFTVSHAKTTHKDPAHKAAVKQSQDLLKDREQVKELSTADTAVKNLDKSVTDLTGSEESTKELYAISADILPILMEMNQDDPEKAMSSLGEYSKNPKAFLERLPADIRLKIEKLAKKIETNKKTKP